MNQRAIPCLFMRGGTSRGPFFLTSDLPENIETRDAVLLAAMGSPDVRQIDGIGGADFVTSKVAIVSPSQRDGVDVDYLFAQVSMERALVDTGPSCGNMLAGIGPFAIERGLVKSTNDETRVMIFNVNTNSRIEAIVRTPSGAVTYEGEQVVDGVPGTAAPITLSFMDIVGSKCGALLPTGRAQEDIEGVPVSCVDVAMPMVMIRSADLGVIGFDPHGIVGDLELMERIESIRLEAGRRMGLGDVTDSVMPKVGILSPARTGGLVSSVYLTPHHLHKAHAVTGAICVACGASITGTVGSSVATPRTRRSGSLRIEHVSGEIEVALEIDGDGADMQVRCAGLVRTARKLMDGAVYVPRSVWS
jgi:4-oxalomesaconate tautomerase